jgi:hypothetical protein
MTYDLGDVVPLGITITDSNGANANASAVTCTIYQPDGTTTSGSVTNPSTGLYNCDFSATQVGRHAVKWLATGTNASAYSDEFLIRDFTELGIVGLDEVKTHLNIPLTDSTLDDELRSFIDAGSDLAESYVGQVLGRRTFTSELYDGGGEFIRIRNPRALSMTSVYENGALVSSSAYALDYTGQRLYRIASSSIYANNAYGYWSQGFNNIQLTYVAGYVNPPMAAKQGVLEIIRHLWQTQRGAMNVTARTLGGDELYQTPTYSLPRRAMELLDPTSFPGMA